MSFLFVSCNLRTWNKKSTRDVLDFWSIKKRFIFPKSFLVNVGLCQVPISKNLFWNWKLCVLFWLETNTTEENIQKQTCVLKNWISCDYSVKLSLQGRCFKNCLPGQTHGIFSHQEAAWLRNPVQGTSCRCHSPVWSPPRLWVPWRRRWADRDSCNGGKWAGLGCLGTIWKKMCTFSAA